MGDYIVQFDARLEDRPPITFRVLNAPNGQDARRFALYQHWGYNPGVGSRVREYRQGDTADYTIDYKPLTPEEIDCVRYSD